MERRFYVTDHGLACGWVSMHSGGFAQVANPQRDRFAPRDQYTPATFGQLEALTEAGILRAEFGHWEHVGGILRNWVPAE